MKWFPNNSLSFLKPVPAFILGKRPQKVACACLCVYAQHLTDTDFNGTRMNLGTNMRNPAAPVRLKLPFNKEATEIPKQDSESVQRDGRIKQTERVVFRYED